MLAEQRGVRLGLKCLLLLGATRRRYNTWRFAFDYGIILVNIHGTHSHSFAFAYYIFVFVTIHSLSSLSDHIILTCFVCLSCQIACCLRLLTMRGPHPGLEARKRGVGGATSPQLSTLPSYIRSTLHTPLLPAFNYLFTLADFTSLLPNCRPPRTPSPPGWLWARPGLSICI